MTARNDTEQDRVHLLVDAGLVPKETRLSPEAVRRINDLSDEEFSELLAIVPKLSTPGSGPTLYYNGPFQTRSFED